MRADDPTRDVKAIRRKNADGFHSWTDAEIAQFEARHPIGTKPRLALALLLYTGQRRSDVVTMGKQHIGRPATAVIDVKQFKTGVALTIPVHGDLQAIIDTTPSEHLTFSPLHSASRSLRKASASGFAHGATRRACSIVRRTVCARRRHDFWRKPDARLTRLRPSPDMHRCGRFRGTPRLPIRPGWRSRR